MKKLTILPAFCLFTLSAALVSQHVFGMMPCTLCVEIRFWLFMSLAASMIAFLPAAIGSRGTSSLRTSICRSTEFLFGIAATAMLITSAVWAYKLVYLEFLDKSMTGCSPIPFYYYDFPLGDWLPGVFATYAICGEGDNAVVGIPYSIWTLSWLGSGALLFLILDLMSIIKIAVKNKVSAA